MSHFYTPWKHQKTHGFLTFSGHSEIWHLIAYTWEHFSNNIPYPIWVLSACFRIWICLHCSSRVHSMGVVKYNTFVQFKQLYLGSGCTRFICFSKKRFFISIIPQMWNIIATMFLEKSVEQTRDDGVFLRFI